MKACVACFAMIAGPSLDVWSKHKHKAAATLNATHKALRGGSMLARGALRINKNKRRKIRSCGRTKNLPTLPTLYTPNPSPPPLPPLKAKSIKRDSLLFTSFLLPFLLFYFAFFSSRAGVCRVLLLLVIIVRFCCLPKPFFLLFFKKNNLL